MIEISGEIEKKFKEELLNWTLSDDGIHRWISRDVSTDLGRWLAIYGVLQKMPTIIQIWRLYTKAFRLS
ncbi:hypothetical protein OAS17_03610 [Methylophilaceae bacterium]|nr:hypothetical protein [Methylophilaceae bacterium]